MKNSAFIRLTFGIFIMLFSQSLRADKPIVVSAKKFVENQLLAEIIAQHLENHDIPVQRKGGLAGTFVAYRALKEGSIDLYVEYSGTVAEAIYKVPLTNFPNLQKHVEADELLALPQLGFNNTYCLVVRKETSEEKNISSISDLADHPNLMAGLSSEFQKRSDGWQGLKKTYNLRHAIKSLENPMMYQALANRKVEFAEAYSTDGIIQAMDFVILEDDRNFFPQYDAFIFSRKDLPKKVISALELLSGVFTEKKMMTLNAQSMAKESFASIASNFLKAEGLALGKQKAPILRSSLDWGRLGRRTWDHLFLTFVAVLLGSIVAIPLGFWIYRKQTWAGPVLQVASLLQTVPSIALLSFMIPFLGIGFKPALAGLFLYSLLPILRNTYTAMSSLDPKLLAMAKGIGLYPNEIFWSVSLPLSLPLIIAGIRTAAIINIGTATLAAFIGAGGLGEPIVMGLAMNDSAVILEGAIPAALLAIVVDFALGRIEKRFVRTL